nr:hypothetical protein [Tanacetum cinerariifolium]
MKGILRQFNVARTPQQNGAVERRNKTLIETARTMLVDFKLLTAFWAEAVNTACYVQNRVCLVTILNTKDHLGKFDAKANEGLFVGYSLNSKAFRVFNSRTRLWKRTYILGTQSNNYLENEDNVNSTNNVNTVCSTVNAVGTNEDNELPFDPNMLTLEDVSTFDFSNEDEDDNIVADINNMDTTIQDVWTLVDLPNEKGILAVNRFEDLDFLDRVYKVKKALYGLHQALRAWYETLSTYLLDNSFQRGKIDKTLFIKRHKGDILLVLVYVDDIIFGSTKKELCNAFKRLMHEKFQMSSMRELTFFLGLQVKHKNDGIFISQDKYVAKILKKFRFIKVKNASTPMETQKPLLKDEDGEKVDVHMYRSMISSLMYFTSSRPDIMFAVCACARYQVNPNISHLHAMKRIFRYLKDQPKLGLWYTKDSSFDLVAYTDSDYAGASLDKKSTKGEAEYVAALSCCGQVLWIQNQLLDYGSGSTTTHSDISLPDHEAFYFDDDHIKEIGSGSTTTHSDISLPDYEAFYFDDDHVNENQEKDKNRIKTEQKREACRSREKFKAVAVERGRKTEENKKRMAENAYTYQKLFKFKEKKKRKGPEMKFFQSTTTGAKTDSYLKLWPQGLVMKLEIEPWGLNLLTFKTFLPTRTNKVKENQEKNKIGSKPDKNGKHGEAGKSQKQLQLQEEEKPKKTKKEWPKTHARIKSY